ncbi:Ldh family oxidoreductase (plasmid) [Pseudorhodobacter turbinis]|uniref:Ldh family oxidoreductase n=1 Tax=Pseudorhodobacter turbinis TaxID=2500533 RepID=A0A4P8EK95_9RHOB|nr:Ldh family oxidoreductase [Pseudorhodobacter turbinis]QCO57486.1 Ldh family oxidoreductase [Pseudorhodobacter turbinis]
MTADITLTPDELTSKVVAIFRAAGFSAQQAGPIAGVIVAGERDACKSHGIYRIEGCLRTLKHGKVVPDAVPTLTQDESAIVRVDAKGGFANAAFEMGAPVLAERAKALGLAALVINDCTHFSALWPEVEALTERGLAAIAMCPSYATVAPTGGTTALMGTNPLAFGWPRAGHAPYVFDFATSVAARGEVELHRIAGKPLPEGWAVDAEGAPTTDPTAALAGAMLPFGGHKGSAISMMIELLAGVMIGDMTSPEALDFLGTTTIAPRHGELIIAFCPDRFAAAKGGVNLDQAEALFDAVLGQGARLPSTRRFTARAESMANGITLNADEQAMLERLLAGGLDAVS